MSETRPQICVVGAGTIGGLLAAHLARVVDVSVLTRRAEQADALEREGLRVSGRAEFIAHLSASADIAALAEPDVVVLGCKGVDLVAAVARLEGHFPTATVVTLQNGLGSEEIVRRHGSWAMVSGFTFMSGTRHSDTHVEYVLDTPTWLGPYEQTPFSHVQALATLFMQAGLKVVALPDIRPARWSKLIFNAAINSVAALTGLPHDANFAREDSPSDLGHLVRALMAEGCAVAEASGIEPSGDPWEMNTLATRRGARHRPSMLEDIQAGRCTEIELISGALVRAAERANMPAPLHSALYGLVKAKEDVVAGGAR